MATYQILYVDDERDNLIAFRAAFRRNFKIHIALSGTEALEVLNTKSIDLVISDQRMPKMTGVDLLEKIKESHPNVLRMLATGYIDMPSTIEAINKGKIYHYIAKPWNVDELRVVLTKALEHYVLRKKHQELEEQKNQLLLQTIQQEKQSILSQFEILKNQINPHFLFNSMNVLSALIHSNPEKAIQFTQQFSKLYRKLLELREDVLISVEKELSFVKNYLFLQKMRFEDSLILNIDIQPENIKAKIPPFALHLLVENAIKHNIISMEKPLNIEITDEGNFLKVVNNLQLKGSPPPGTKIGLSNLQARYELITAEKVTFYAGEKEYVVRIPLINFE